jgi:GTP:adenosylcobinamide-phosphate guanylyltransferase
MHVVITAGGVPRPDESLFSLTQGGYKAMLAIAGKPMLQWVLDALNATPRIEQIVVVGLPPIETLKSEIPITFLPNQGDILNNIQAGALELLRQDSTTQQFLVISSDVPGVTPEMINWTIDRVNESDVDLYYTAITRKVMEQRFPESKRTYLRLKDIEACGGDVNAARAPMFQSTNPLWHKIIETRKSPIKQALLLGVDTLLLILLRALTMAQTERRVCKRLGITGRVIPCPFAEIGMDVDKIFQYEIMQRDLTRLHGA